MSSGINIFLHRVVAQQGIPFPLTLEQPLALDEKTLALESKVKEAVRTCIADLKVKGLPIARYDAEQRRPYLEYPDERKEYSFPNECR
jgi:hypothetical protein